VIFFSDIVGFTTISAAGTCRVDTPSGYSLGALLVYRVDG
jgi:hypothetical protein